MIWQWVAVAAPVLMALVLFGALLRLRGRTRDALAAARAEAAELRERLEALERPTPSPASIDVTEYRITGLGDPDPEDAGTAAPVERAVFADVLLRESVIRLGSLGHGVRRAMSAESRNRIRFEMRRELKRARKQRRAEQREAYREWQARQRDDLRESA